jgi:hypothetical protein
VEFHLARNGASELEVSEDPVSFRLKLWFDRVFILAANLAGMAQSTLCAKRRALERQIDDILATPKTCAIASELIAKSPARETSRSSFVRSPAKWSRRTMDANGLCGPPSSNAVNEMSRVTEPVLLSPYFVAGNCMNAALRESHPIAKQSTAEYARGEKLPDANSLVARS